MQRQRGLRGQAGDAWNRAAFSHAENFSTKMSVIANPRNMQGSLTFQSSEKLCPEQEREIALDADCRYCKFYGWQIRADMVK